MHFTYLALLSVSPVWAQTPNLDWWRTAVFYQIYPRSFKDSNNDGIGDIGGIVQKIDHLAETGVTAIWLSPIYKSPQVDHGYDISDFRDVDPLFGSLEILKVLISKCHDKGIKVILDFVPNHTSDKHEWFAKSENKELGYEDYYVWKEGKSEGGPPNNWISHFHGSAWEYSSKRGQYFLHQFAIGQPDLNYHNPKVVQEMKDVLVYWLKLGVDGFRMDIVPTLYEHPEFLDEPRSFSDGATPNDHAFLNHVYTYDQPETYEMVYQWRKVLDDFQAKEGGDTRVMMIETYSEGFKTLAFYGNETHLGAHFPFNFWFITKLDRYSDAGDIIAVVEKWLAYTNLHNYTANWVLGNHDQHRVASRYGTDRIDGLAIFTLMLPGVGVIYNGEEIGMEDGEVTWIQGEDPQACNGLIQDFVKNSRDFQRTPYQWDATVNAGFNEGAETWLPVSSKYQNVNLKNQLVNDTKSHYRIYQALIRARKSDTVKYGTANLLDLTPNVLGLRRVRDGNPTYLIIANIGDKQENVDLAGLGVLPEKLTVLIASLSSKRGIGDVIQTKVITVEPYEAFVATGNAETTDAVTTSPNAGGGASASNLNCLLFVLIVTSIIF